MSDREGSWNSAQFLLQKGEIDRPAPVALITAPLARLGVRSPPGLRAGGYRLVLLDKRADALSVVCHDLHEKTDCALLAFNVDLAATDQVKSAVNGAAKRLRRMDAVVNNAGVNSGKSLDTLEQSDWDEAIAVNLRASAFICQALLPVWRAQGGGAIVNVGSRVWLSGAQPAYTASKAGLIGLTRALATELGPLNVSANVVAPGFIDTELTRHDRSEAELNSVRRWNIVNSRIPRLALEQDIACTVEFLVSEGARFITGEVIHVCGGAQLAPQTQPPASFVQTDHKD